MVNIPSVSKTSPFGISSILKDDKIDTQKKLRDKYSESKQLNIIGLRHGK